jgi:hypothetical protein
MKKIVSLHVDISHPCSEKWGEMQPVEGGRFCERCCKKVIDFSFMSDEEVLRTVEKHGNGLCGRYREDQLNRELVTEKGKSHSLVPAIVLSTMLTAGAAGAAFPDAKAASVEMIQSDTLTPPCIPPDTTETALAGYSALGRDFQVKGYAVTKQRLVTGGGPYLIKYEAIPVKTQRKWYQFWKRR